MFNMLSTCSPHQEICATMQMHSPAHPLEYDPHAAIREIRRSLSRSPSKTAELRQYAYRSSPGSGSIPFSPSPLSPSRRSTSDNVLHLSTLSSPHSSRVSQTSRIQRPTLRRSAQGFSVMRLRTSPKSPSKRALADLYDNGNATPLLRKRNSSEVEAQGAQPLKVTADDKENINSHCDDGMSWKPVPTRQEKRRSGGLLTEIVPLSPMKRTSEPMNIDQPDFGSPSTKRRSIHTSSGLDFSIFDSDSLHSSLEKRSQDDNDWCRTTSPHAATRFSTIPKRSSSLRKSTLQQRQPERFHFGRTTPSGNVVLNWMDGSPSPDGKKTTRLSLDNHLPDLQRDSPFSAQGNLLSASVHPIASSQPRHPLSRTMTQSSSTPSAQDESPTHEPMRRPEHPSSHDFSKSLPVGALRPVGEASREDHSSQTSFATPAAYKSARPLPAAFMSTGLISKKNRNAEDPDGGLPKAHMPDTPCKRQSVLFDSNSKFRPIHNVVKQRPSFGTPGTPADTPFGFSRSSIFPFGKSTSLFGPRNTKQTLVRKASFASIESEDKTISQSPSGPTDSQSTDIDYPPTPTKHANIEMRNSTAESPSSIHRISSSHNIFGSTQALRFANSKLSPIQSSPNTMDGDGDGDSAMEDSPSTVRRPKSLFEALAQPTPSFTQSRASRNLNSPTPLSRHVFVSQDLSSSALRRTKTFSHVPVSPLLESVDNFLPHTPSEGVYPPDPSSLSISARAERPVTRPGSSHVPFVPATPTGPREYFGNFSNRPSLNLNASDIVDVDRSLAAKFDKAELVGTGEFSQVYRVSLPPESSPFSNSFTNSSRSSSRRSTPDRVWAVKKSRYAYSGPKDRQRKVQEVDILKVLGQGEHILTFVDSWEDRGHLYIQTEFCEEGTLDVFLSQMGLKARLDDFRIWKILLELSMGLKHIHDNGYIHLDLKPANVLITFDGTLKIGDFGMASKWPAKAGIEGEGDREYIGPEILMGQYDKPADVFALGLIMLETAGNVELPDNGVSWQKLRQGDMSDVPSLTFSSDVGSILRDASGNPLRPDEHGLMGDVEQATDGEPGHVARRGELTEPPDFMVSAEHEQALDNIVRWMISPVPSDRPLIQQVLETQGIQFAASRRRAGATIFEGNWGPADEIIAEDAEMIDV